MQRLVFTNGGGQTIDLTSGNFGITNWEGLSGVGLNIQTQQVPFQDGGVFLDALMEQREISVTVAIQDNNDLSARYERKRQLISALNPKLGEGVLVYTNDYLSRQIKAVPQLPIFENKNSNDAGTLKASVVFSCPSPYWEDLEETVINANLKSIAIANNEGDIPVQVEIELFGNATNPKITNLRNNKHIEYQEQLDMPLYINTGIGVKEVSAETLGFEYNQFKGYIWGVYYINEINSYVALSEGCLLFSVDGKNWDIHKIGFDVYCFSMIYNSTLEKYIIGCNNGELLQSEDLYNWTHLGSIFNGVNNAVRCWDMIYVESSDMIVVCGYDSTGNGVLYTKVSSSGWTKRIEISSKWLLSVVYSATLNMFVTVGVDGLLYYSTDGETWIDISLGGTDNFHDVYFSENLSLFVIAGDEGIIYTSSDGINWTSENSSTNKELDVIFEVTEGGHTYLLIAGKDVLLCKNSTWEVLEDSESIIEVPNSICYSNVTERFVMVGRNGMILSSDNGITEWERQDKGEYYTLRGIVFAKGLYVAVGDYGVIITSQNKTDWIERESNVTSAINGIVYSEEKEIFVAVCSDGNVLKSNDGINWQIALTLTGTLIRIKWVKEKHYFLIIRGGTSSNAIYITEDLSTYTSYSAPYNVLDIAYFPKGDFFIVSINTSNNNMPTTTDFVNYEQHTSPYSLTRITSIVYANNMLVAVGTTSNATGLRTSIITSEDGIIWRGRTNSTIPMKNAIKIIYSTTYEKFVVTGESGLVLMSSDGIQWENFDTDVVTFLSDIIDHNLELVFAGDSSIIMSTIAESTDNKIQYLSSDSDLNFNLATGENKIRLTKLDGNFSARIKYRQKYIGV